MAFVVLNPALKSRAAADKAGQELYSDSEFFDKMKTLFEGEPTGEIRFPSTSDLAQKVSELKTQIESLQKQIDGLKKKHQ